MEIWRAALQRIYSKSVEEIAVYSADPDRKLMRTLSRTEHGREHRRARGLGVTHRHRQSAAQHKRGQVIKRCCFCPIITTIEEYSEGYSGKST